MFRGTDLDEGVDLRVPTEARRMSLEIMSRPARSLAIAAPRLFYSGVCLALLMANHNAEFQSAINGNGSLLVFVSCNADRILQFSCYSYQATAPVVIGNRVKIPIHFAVWSLRHFAIVEQSQVDLRLPN